MNIWYALVALLPFEWAESGSMFFMKNALLAILVISPLFGLMSTMVVQSRMSFFSDALGHSAFAGIAIGTLCGLAAPTWCAVALAVVFALLFSLVRHRSDLASDTVIGVFSSTAVALGIFLSTLGGSSFTKFNSLLVGDILLGLPRPDRAAGRHPAGGGRPLGGGPEPAHPERRPPRPCGQPGGVPVRGRGGVQLRGGGGGHPDHRPGSGCWSSTPC